MVLAVSAKHQMSSVAGFVAIETGFIVLQYLVVSPLIALAFAGATQAAQPSRRLA
jgi:hypothetical protein